uniref:Putative membrane glycoprotein lig-1 n=1 Tax=Anopheles braziliensis TaxID=58242 RepID=A0A2M3ZE50_9DIPT
MDSFRDVHVWLLVVFVGSASALHYDCLPSKILEAKETPSCLLNGVTLPTTEHLQNVTFNSNHAAVTMEHGHLPHFSAELARKLPKVEDLTLVSMGVRKLFISRSLKHLSAYNNSIETLDFDDGPGGKPGGEYELTSLVLNGGLLKTVPPLGGRFNRLKLLSLDNNLLEQVKLDDFLGLTQLQSLSLASNRLIKVEFGASPNHPGFALLKLMHLSLAGNQLLTLNTTGWELGSLASLDLSGNNLYLLAGGLDSLRALKELRYAQNDWNCEWLSKVQLHLASEAISVVDREPEGRCAESAMKELQGICCYEHAELDYSTDVFGTRWEQLAGLQRQYELLQYTHDLQTVKESEAIVDEDRVFRSRLDRVNLVQDGREQSLKRLQSNVAGEVERMDRLSVGITRSLAELRRSLNDLYQLSIQPEPSLDAIRLQTAAGSVKRIKAAIEKLRRGIREYAGSTEMRENHIRRLGERMAAVNGKILQFELENKQLEQHVADLEATVKMAYDLIDRDPSKPLGSRGAA